MISDCLRRSFHLCSSMLASTANIVAGSPRVYGMYTKQGILGNFVLLVPMQAIKSIRINVVKGLIFYQIPSLFAKCRNFRWCPSRQELFSEGVILSEAKDLLFARA